MTPDDLAALRELCDRVEAGGRAIRTLDPPTVALVDGWQLTYPVGQAARLLLVTPQHDSIPGDEVSITEALDALGWVEDARAVIDRYREAAS